MKRTLTKPIQLSDSGATLINIGGVTIAYTDCLKLLDRIDVQNNWSYSVLLHPSNKFLLLESASDEPFTGFGTTSGTYEVKTISRDEARKIVEDQGEEFDDYFVDQYLKNMGKWFNSDRTPKVS